MYGIHDSITRIDVVVDWRYEMIGRSVMLVVKHGPKNQAKLDWLNQQSIYLIGPRGAVEKQ